MGKKNPLMWGIKNTDGPDGTVYFMHFEWTAQDVVERPLDVATAVRDRILEVMKQIQGTLITENVSETEDQG